MLLSGLISIRRVTFLGLFLLPILLRLALMPFHGVPVPTGGDDFSYLLQADTLTHFRLANPTHPMHRFFETDFELQEPTYSSIYPLGQGLFLALGQIATGLPWAGVLLASGLFCALCYWAMLARLSHRWALVGALGAVVVYGPLCSWTNSYWGGHVAGIAGCLIFGGLARFRDSLESKHALLVGAGLGLGMLTRPFETALLVVAIAYFVPRVRAIRWVALAILPFLCVTALHNRAVTGLFTKLPYQVSREQYGVPTTFRFQALPTPTRDLTREQRLDYLAQSAIHDAPTSVVTRLEALQFFLPLPLIPAFVAAAFARHRIALIPIAGLFVGTLVYPYFYPHYLALVAPLFLFAITAGLERLPRPLAVTLMTFAALQFAILYGVHLKHDPQQLAAIERFEAPNYISWGDSEGRREVGNRLERESGPQLVFVRYSQQHGFHEWVANEADIDASKIIWARDLGPAPNTALKQYYPSRKAWLLEPDGYPPRLAPYRDPPPPAALPPQTSPAPKRPKEQGAPHFEGVQSLPLSGFIKH